MDRDRENRRGTIVFNGINGRDYGLWLQGGGTFNAPARRYNTVSIPGRNGSLTIDTGAFEEVEHIYPAFIMDDFPENVRGLRNAFLASPGYHRLEDSYHTDEYYRARYMDGLAVDVAPMAVAGTFDLRFMRDPRRFLKIGDIQVTVADGGYIENPTAFDAKPLIRVTGYGEMYVGNDKITIEQQYEYIDIDCEIMDCYHGTSNANPYVEFQKNDFPVLSPGRTGITCDQTITRIEITPHWWRI